MPWKPIDGERVFMFEYPFDQKGSTAAACAIRAREGELIVISPACGLSEADFTEIEKHGRPVALVAPNGFHHLRLPEWHRRYPEAKLFGPAPAAKRIAKKHPGIPRLESMDGLAAFCSPDVAIFDPPGMRIPDVIARVALPGGAVWSFNDTIMNMAKLPPGFFGKVMKWTDSAPGFKVMRAFTMVGVKDKKGFKSWLLGELEKAPAAFVTTSHGAPILDREQAKRLPQMFEAAL
jgi:hypothetical protein